MTRTDDGKIKLTVRINRETCGSILVAPDMSRDTVIEAALAHEAARTRMRGQRFVSAHCNASTVFIVAIPSVDDVSALGFSRDSYAVVRVEGVFVCLRLLGPLGVYERTFWTVRPPSIDVSTLPVCVAALIEEPDRPGHYLVRRPGADADAWDLPWVTMTTGECAHDAARRSAEWAGARFFDPRTLVFDQMISQFGGSEGCCRFVVYSGPTRGALEAADMFRRSLSMESIADRHPILGAILDAARIAGST